MPTLQTEVAQVSVIVRTATQRPVDQTGLGLDSEVVDGSVPESHKAVFIELPVLVPVGAKPILRIVKPLVREAPGDAVAGRRPQFLDEAFVSLYGTPMRSCGRNASLPFSAGFLRECRRTARQESHGQCLRLPASSWDLSVRVRGGAGCEPD